MKLGPKFIMLLIHHGKLISTPSVWHVLRLRASFLYAQDATKLLEVMTYVMTLIAMRFFHFVFVDHFEHFYAWQEWWLT
jgi:hypothetical protein